MKKKISINFLWVLIASPILFSCGKLEPEDYLISKGYKGRVDIIFNQKGGVPLKYENGRRVYEIPSDGILFTQFKDEYGLTDHKYYYIDNTGKRTMLKIYQRQYNKDGSTKWDINDSHEVGIFLDGTTGNYGENNENKFQEFLVSDSENIDSFFTAKYKTHFGTKLRNLLKDSPDTNSLNEKEMDSVENLLNQKKLSN